MLPNKSTLCFLLGVPLDDFSTVIPFTVFFGDVAVILEFLSFGWMGSRDYLKLLLERNFENSWTDMKSRPLTANLGNK